MKTLADKKTKEFWDTGKSRGMPPANLRNVAKRKFAALDAARPWRTCEFLPAIDWKSCGMTEKGSTAFGSTINSACASCGETATPMMWKSPTTTERALQKNEDGEES